MTAAAVKAYLDIVAVVGDCISLVPQGSNYVALCPFHTEMNPSFYVSRAKQFCKCFVCGKGGDVLDFLMEYEDVSLPEAIRRLASRYSIPAEISGVDATTVPILIPALNAHELEAAGHWSSGSREYLAIRSENFMSLIGRALDQDLEPAAGLQQIVREAYLEQVALTGARSERKLIDLYRQHLGKNPSLVQYCVAASRRSVREWASLFSAYVAGVEMMSRLSALNNAYADGKENISRSVLTPMAQNIRLCNK